MRGRTIHLILLLLAFPSVGASLEFADVRARAQAIAAKPFEPRDERLPETLARLNYDEYRAIQFDSKQALWKESRLPFQIEFFHRGGNHKQTVAIHELDSGEPRLLPYRAEAFRYGTNRLQVPPDLGYAGFRIVHPVNEFGELATFLDASYFRMIGRGQIYGTSARGLALNTTSGQSEEFPAFREFWIHKPEKRARGAITLYALLDSPSVAGAYQFLIRPGTETVAEVKASLFPRREVKEFGIAPLTSMFLHGENGRPAWSDFRPEVHDADGLLIHNGHDEWIWHPLEAGRMLRVNAFQDQNPKGFGLIQRDRDYEHYQDLVAKYHKRPSVWVKPVGQWGKGAVELVQLPSNVEYTDNVVAFWVPETPPIPGSALDVEYELRWTLENPTPKNLAHVHATRIGRVNASDESSNLRFIVDFAGKAIKSLSAEEKLKAEVRSDKTEIVKFDVVRNELNHTWRLIFEIANPTQAVDLRARLHLGAKPLTETWTFTWQP